MNSLCFVYIPCASKAEALTISKALLEEKLIACSGIIENIYALYWWKGQIEANECEYRIEAETRSDKLPQITKIVQKLHSYECPVIMSIPIQYANEECSDWIHEVIE